ncbi:MAG: ferrous iron transport protein B [Methanobrevibacter sp.]|jgi:ferrous iron transport protein B|nr:ferrous iron transport protein B [Candidatus Methanoflexus mossambicus]
MNIKIGLAGNPNVGKTTLFNQLTGLNQHVGNWPGKTVEKAEGHLKYGEDKIDVIDLPGNYALSAHSIEEIVSRDFIVDEGADVIINVVDATNLERNLYLTTQMMELNANLVLALNMNKFAKKRDLKIDIKELSQLLGIPVVEIEAIDKTGKEDLLKVVKEKVSKPTQSSKKLVYGAELNEHLIELEEVIKKDEKLLDVPANWIAIKLLENDEIIKEKVVKSKISNEIFYEVEKTNKHFKDVFGESSEEVIANYRYAFIDGLLNEAITRPEIEKPTITEKIDSIVTNRILGIPIFLVVMYLIFQITFTISAPFQDLIEQGFGILGNGLMAWLGESYLSSFLVDGVIGGVGGVLVFVPVIFFMFLMISILEDSGYLARAAFVMDRVMHKLVGLHGKAFIPMILGFGCGVPGIMATRTMEHERDRLLTMLIIPFMSCTARLPIYAMLIAAFFSAQEGNVLFAIYFIGVVVAIIVAAILKKTVFKGITSPFVMELPSYKIPSVKGILLHTWEKCSGFVKKAGTLIFAVAVIVWVLGSFPLGVEYAAQESVLGQIGTIFTPIFAPLGFTHWESTVSLITGVAAKEVVVGTLSSVFGVAEGGAALSVALHGIFTPLTAFTFMIFCLLYVPCFAAVGTVKSETNSWKWPIIMIAITFVTAYVVSFLVYNVGVLLGYG